jgi:membrane peptidoglycan carboxypeptidase
MHTYGHPQSSGDANGAGYDGYDSYGSYQDAYAADPYRADQYQAEPHPPAARARASVGSAAGSAPVGRASVAAPEAPSHRYDWGRGGAAGRAPVPISPGGPATGRASVRPGGPGGPAPQGGGSGSRRPPGRKQRHWVRNSLLSALAALVIAAGGGMVALSYYVESVPAPEDVDMAEASTILYSDGEREMATLREVNRQIIDTSIPELENVRNAVIAAEDQDFYDHSGVDFDGIIRAAWNNFTGGARQGASTIDQQYARAAADLTEDSYTRKLREAAMAYKLNQDHSKQQILDFYLNQVYFGRGAYGIQAAAVAYFGKDAVELTVDEAAVLAGTIRIPDDGSGLSPYDPRHNPDDPSTAVARWSYVLGQMIEMGTLDQAARAEMVELPETVDPEDAKEWHNGPQGNIVRQVQFELQDMGITDASTGGYRVTTTIDRDLQKAAVDAARRKNDASYWDGMPKNVNAAIVAVNPADGGVLAYYGGEDGTGIDMAGPYPHEDTGELTGGWPPGSSAKIYTLIAELREGISFDSHWKTSEYKPDWADITVRNAGRDARDQGCEGRAPDYCTLRWSTQYSFNVPFAHFSEAVPDNQGPTRILQAAMDAGVTMIKDDDGEVHDLTALGASDVAPEYVYHPIAYGQYAITVLDHANGVATLAARGVYNEAHFVRSVEQKVDGEWVPVDGERINGEQRVQQEHADAITGVLAAVPGLNGVALEGGRPAAAKTGTWEHVDQNDFVDGNADAWVVGYTPQIAAAVWVGDPKRGKIVDQFGQSIGSSGLPAFIWKNFMDSGHAAKEYPPEAFPPPQVPGPGNPQHPYANGEQPRGRDGGDPRCLLPFVDCDDDDNGGRGNGDGGNGGEYGGTGGGLGLVPLPPVLPPDQDE